MFDRVLCQRVKAATSIGGILLPDTVAGGTKINEAKVIAVGKVCL